MARRKELSEIVRSRIVFNDPIHGHIELHPLLVSIIDTPQFQRLRHLKQLGATDFVYPGACHTRFEHSIGVCYLAEELMNALKLRQTELNITKNDILCVQIAGLCHDLGHGPFSHTFDGMFIPKARPGLGWKHETASVQMLDHLLDKNNLRTKLPDHGLKLPEDLVFIKEQIAGPLRNHVPPGQWPYQGRQEEKSFLYEIVANNNNGIDVDKFDYLARDSYYLGMQNSFDHRRYLKFLRVCEVDGLKHICPRDKEVGNLYDMFYTRYSLHRRACQHKVGNIIATMITEAFVKADKHFKIIGSDGKTFSLSTAIEDMEAYTKLTDHIFQEILNSSSPELAEARAILQNINCRKLYKFLGKIRPKNPVADTSDECTRMAASIAQALPDSRRSVTLQAEDFEVTIINMDYGMKNHNLIKNVYFYTKNDPTNARIINEDEVSQLLPKTFAEQLIRVYCKKTDDINFQAAKICFEEWCKRPRLSEG
ncbi:deoxynucleoside triphosphate triphosphohydrolase SAMHD1-like [Conger conger]|uniref:deoxynucleoside triphosphate triphosphohydrolase SAMHD1-like n=1 Tax=Conger conger TaxID=82655 RepID=UPI002A5A2676|nr:deoxynucleoside triphosphate triphosphohydrolase SAMHD1-like [Conger conger]